MVVQVLFSVISKENVMVMVPSLSCAPSQFIFVNEGVVVLGFFGDIV